MLKRVNIHIEETDWKELGNLARKIQAGKPHVWGQDAVVRADLVRHALANTFGFTPDNLHMLADRLKKAVKKALRKAT